MPNRILKESVRYSDTINQLTWQEEALFYRLLTACDDYGIFDARPAVLRGALCSLRLNDVADDYIVSWLAALEGVGLISCYMVGGRPYLSLATWARHQTVRTQRAKYPMPGEGQIFAARTCMQMYADAGKCSRNPIQSEINPDLNPDLNVGTDVPTPLADSTRLVKFGTESEPYLLAVHLRARILANDCDARVPAETPDKLSSWSAEMDKLVRIDHRDADCIRRVIDWAESDQFWRANILSPPSLRKQFTRLHLAMQAPNRSNGPRASPPPVKPSRQSAFDREVVSASDG